MTNEFLKQVPLFQGLSAEDLNRLCEMAEEVPLQASEVLFVEGSTGDRAYVIQEGQVEIIKSSGGREILLAIRTRGEVIGEMSLLESAPRIASARARTASLLLAITQEQIDHLLSTSPSAVRAMLHTFVGRLRSTDAQLRQSEKMAQIGVLTAGLAHELNNPASAVKRGAEQLRNALQNLLQAQAEVYRLGNDFRQSPAFTHLQEILYRRTTQPVTLDLLARSDLEAEWEEWLEEQGVQTLLETASCLAQIGLQTNEMQDSAQTLDREQLEAALAWWAAQDSVTRLMEEIDQGAGRMSEIVHALKMYAYLDQGPVQSVDVQAGLENTLILLRSKFGPGITVERHFASGLPKIEAYGSELNQVWTNLIDNAIEATGEHGKISLRTRSEGQWVVVEIEDSGHGIPAEIQSKIFDPFFTTRPPGQGTGLGLNISYNIIMKHGGEIRVASQPGKTVFEVWLPVSLPSSGQPQAAASTASAVPQEPA